MRLLPIAMIQPGMRLGRAVLSEDGKVLLGYHVELTSSSIRKLANLGFTQLYIDDPRTDDITVEDTLRDDTRAAVRSALIRIFNQLSGTNSQSDLLSFSRNASQCFGFISDDLGGRRLHADDTIMVSNLLRSNTTQLEHFYQNAVNVCVYAFKVGVHLGMTKDELHAFGMGALLHDIGNTQIPLSLLQKNSSLTPAEFAEIQKHTVYGYKLLKDTPGIPLLSAHCALQHHEKIGGGGYPSSLAGNAIHPYAKWVGMLDAYDAMTNPRPYRPAIRPDQALEILFAGAGTLYDRDKVELFRNKVAIYPIGLSVRLSTGDSGIVSKIHATYKHRPTVRVLRNGRGEELKQPYEIDLSRHLHIMIHCIGEDSLAK